MKHPKPCKTISADQIVDTDYGYISIRDWLAMPAPEPCFGRPGVTAQVSPSLGLVVISDGEQMTIGLMRAPWWRRVGNSSSFHTRARAVLVYRDADSGEPWRLTAVCVLSRANLSSSHDDLAFWPLDRPDPQWDLLRFDDPVAVTIGWSPHHMTCRAWTLSWASRPAVHSGSRARLTYHRDSRTIHATCPDGSTRVARLKHAGLVGFSVWCTLAEAELR